MGDEQQGNQAGRRTRRAPSGLRRMAQRAIGLALVAGAGAILLVAWVDLRSAPQSSVSLAAAMPEPVPIAPVLPEPVVPEPDPAALGTPGPDAGTPEAAAPEPAAAQPETPPNTIAEPEEPGPQRSVAIAPPAPVPLPPEPVPPEPVPPAPVPPDPGAGTPEIPRAAGKAGLPSWQRFAISAPLADGRKRIAIIIDDCGLDRPRTARAIGLPGQVTLSFIAYAGDLPRQTEAARRAGHELLVHVPMEPISRTRDMGPNGLATDLTRAEVLRRLRWDLDRFDGYVGINNHMGSRFTGDERSMEPVIGELKARGLLFVDSRTVANSTGIGLSRSLGVPYASRDVFLDNEQTSDEIGARLKDVEAVARRRGAAVAIGHPHDATLAALTAWFATLPSRSFVLVPISALVKVQGSGN